MWMHLYQEALGTQLVPDDKAGVEHAHTNRNVCVAYSESLSGFSSPWPDQHIPSVRHHNMMIFHVDYSRMLPWHLCALQYIHVLYPMDVIRKHYSSLLHSSAGGTIILRFLKLISMLLLVFCIFKQQQNMFFIISVSIIIKEICNWVNFFELCVQVCLQGWIHQVWLSVIGRSG